MKVRSVSANSAYKYSVSRKDPNNSLIWDTSSSHSQVVFGGFEKLKALKKEKSIPDKKSNYEMMIKQASDKFLCRKYILFMK
jgi:hypothetical protein